MIRLFIVGISVMLFKFSVGQIIHYDVTFPNSDNLTFASEPPEIIGAKAKTLQLRGSSSIYSLLTVHDSTGAIKLYCDGVDFHNAEMDRFEGLKSLRKVLSPNLDPLSLTSSHWRSREIFSLGSNKYILFSLHSGLIVKRVFELNGKNIQEIDEPVLLDSGGLFDKLTSVRVPGRSVQWLITKNYGQFMAYPIENGHMGNAVVSKGIERGETPSGKPSRTSFNNMIASRDGKTLISLEHNIWPNSTGIDPPSGGIVYQYDFDYATGKVTNQNTRVKINYKDFAKNEFDHEPYSSTKFIDVAFSPNDSIIYAITRSTRKDIASVWQIPRYSSTPAFQISTYRDSTENYALSSIFQAPNGKLYIMHNAFEYDIGGGWHTTENRIGVINHPNVLGDGCSVKLNVFKIDSDYNFLRNVYTSYLPRARFKLIHTCNGGVKLANISDDKFSKYDWFKDSELVATTSDLSDSVDLQLTPGIYYYKIRGTTAKGLTIWFSDSIQVKSKLIYNASLSADSVCQWNELNLETKQFCYSHKAESGISAYWNFGDGSTSKALYPTHTYNDTGLYSINGWVSNGYDTIHLLFDSIRVVAGPKPGIILSDSVLCSPARIGLKDTIENVRSRRYTWDDGFESNQSEHYRLLEEGHYSISQELESITGCKSAITTEIKVEKGIDDMDLVKLRSTQVNLNSVKIQFEPIDGIFDYTLIRNASGGKSITAKLTAKDLLSHSYVSNNLSTSDTVYAFSVRAFDACGEKTVLLDTLQSISLFTSWQNSNNLQFEWNTSRAHFNKNYALLKSVDSKTWSTVYQGDNTKFIYNNPFKNNDNLLFFKLIQVSKDQIDTSISNIIKVSLESRLSVPNAFSPNGDGINDIFKVGHFGIKTFSCTIYGRNGQVVSFSQNPNAVWDGMVREQPAPAGVYQYIIAAVDEQGEAVQANGTITLVR